MPETTTHHRTSNVAQDIREKREDGLPTPERAQQTRLAWRKRVQGFIDYRTWALKEYAGTRYGTDKVPSDEEGRPINKPYELVTTLFPNFSVDDPRNTVMPENHDMLWNANVMREQLDYIGIRIRLGDVLNEAGADGFFTPAVVKLGMDSVKLEDAGSDRRRDSGMIYADNIDFEDWIGDPSANKVRQFGMQGHCFQMPFDRAMDEAETRGWNSKVLQRIYDTQRDRRNKSQSNKDIGGQNEFAHSSEFLYDIIELCEITFYDEKTVVTLDGSWVDPINEYVGTKDYFGPDNGNYTVLNYLFMPNQPIPPSVIGEMADTASIINTIVKSIAHQAKSQKDFYTVLEAHKADLQKAYNVRPGEGFGVLDQNAIKVHSIGGVNNSNYQSLAFFDEIWNRQAGNPALLGGAGRNAPTNAQDERKERRAGVRVDEMAKKFFRFASDIMEKVAWYVLKDQKMFRKWTGDVDGLPTPMAWPEGRHGEFRDYRVSLSVYDAGTDSPSAQYQRALQFFNEVYIPILGLPEGTVPQDVVSKLARMARVPKDLLFTLLPTGQDRTGQRLTSTRETTNISQRVAQPSNPGLDVAKVAQTQTQGVA